MRATPTTGTTLRFVPFLRVRPDCTLSTCLAISSISTLGGSTLAWTNSDSAPRSVIITYAAYPPTMAMPIDLAFRIQPPPSYVTCAASRRVTDGTSPPIEECARRRTSAGASSPTPPATAEGPYGARRKR